MTHNRKQPLYVEVMSSDPTVLGLILKALDYSRSYTAHIGKRRDLHRIELVEVAPEPITR